MREQSREQSREQDEQDKQDEQAKRATQTELAYLAGYIERSGSLCIYTQQLTSKTPGRVSHTAIASAGIRVRLRDCDPAALNLAVARFGGKVTHRHKVYFWSATNDRAATLLASIYPFLRRGTRRVLVSQLLEFHLFMKQKRKRAKLLSCSLSFSQDDLAEIAAYRAALREMKGQSG